MTLENIFPYLFLLLFILTLSHIFYEFVIAPTRRMRLRHQLFALRDKLHTTMYENKNIDMQLAYKVQNAINVTINHLSQFDFRVFLIMQSNNFADVKGHYDQLIDELNTTEVKELKDIFEQVNLISFSAFVINIKPFLAYIMPFWYLGKVLGVPFYVGQVLKVKDFIRDALSTPEKTVADMECFSRNDMQTA